jgi:two-component system, cell cycle response regulator
MPRILIVDDHPDMLDTLEHLFSFFQFDVLRAENGKQGLEMAGKHIPDIILLDALMPVLDGFETCKLLKKKRTTRSIPVVFLTAEYKEEKDRQLAMQLGADDYIVKPYNSQELVKRIKAVLGKKRAMGDLKQQNEDLAARQQANKEKSPQKETAPVRERDEDLMYDPLTGLYDKKHVAARLKEEFHRAMRYEVPLSLLIIDIDGFVRINNLFGFPSGDYVLLKMANILLNHTRHADIVARLEGANFLVILPQTNEQAGYLEAERLRIALGQADYINDFLFDVPNTNQHKQREPVPLTVSIGLATYPSAHKLSTEKDLMRIARRALDRAKIAGRNKTKVSEKTD